MVVVLQWFSYFCCIVLSAAADKQGATIRRSVVDSRGEVESLVEGANIELSAAPFDYKAIICPFLSMSLDCSWSAFWFIGYLTGLLNL